MVEESSYTVEDSFRNAGENGVTTTSLNSHLESGQQDHLRVDACIRTKSDYLSQTVLDKGEVQSYTSEDSSRNADENGVTTSPDSHLESGEQDQLQVDACIRTKFNYLFQTAPDEGETSSYMTKESFPNTGEGEAATFQKPHLEDDQQGDQECHSFEENGEVLIPVKVEGKWRSATLDTGSEVTIISTRVIQEMESRMHRNMLALRIHKSERNLYGYQAGSALEMEGRINIDIEIGGKLVTCLAYIDAYAQRDVLLGMDFLKEAGGSFVFHTTPALQWSVLPTWGENGEVINKVYIKQGEQNLVPQVRELERECQKAGKKGSRRNTVKSDYELPQVEWVKCLPGEEMVPQGNFKYILMEMEENMKQTEDGMEDATVKMVRMIQKEGIPDSGGSENKLKQYQWLGEAFGSEDESDEMSNSEDETSSEEESVGLPEDDYPGDTHYWGDIEDEGMPNSDWQDCDFFSSYLLENEDRNSNRCREVREDGVEMQVQTEEIATYDNPHRRHSYADQDRQSEISDDEIMRMLRDELPYLQFRQVTQQEVRGEPHVNEVEGEPQDEDEHDAEEGNEPEAQEGDEQEAQEKDEQEAQEGDEQEAQEGDENDAQEGDENEAQEGDRDQTNANEGDGSEDEGEAEETNEEGGDDNHEETDDEETDDDYDPDDPVSVRGRESNDEDENHRRRHNDAGRTETHLFHLSAGPDIRQNEQGEVSGGASRVLRCTLTKSNRSNSCPNIDRMMKQQIVQVKDLKRFAEVQSRGIGDGQVIPGYIGGDEETPRERQAREREQSSRGRPSTSTTDATASGGVELNSLDPLAEDNKRKVRRVIMRRNRSTSDLKEQSLKRLLNVLLLTIILGFCAETKGARNSQKPRQGLIAPNPLVCQTDRGGMLWKLPGPVSCPDVNMMGVSVPIPETRQLYKRNLMQYKVTATHCRKVKVTTVTHETFFGHETIPRIERKDVSVDAQECKRMHDYKRCEQGDLTLHATLWQTTKKVTLSYPGSTFWCCKEVPHTITQCFMYETTVYKRHTAKQMESPVGDVGHCTYSDGVCSLLDGSVLIWTPEPKEQCEYIEWMVSAGKIMREAWLSADENIALTSTNQNSDIDCKKRQIFISQQGIPYRTLERTPYQSRTRLTRDKRQIKTGAVGVVGTEQLSAELQAVEWKSLEAVRTAFRHAIATTCHGMNDLSLHTRSMMLANPTLAARTLTGKSNVFARAGWNLLEVFPCTELEDGTFWFQPMNDSRCTEHIPILFNVHTLKNYTGYMDSLTGIVHQTSNIQDCSLSNKIPFVIQGKAYEYERKTGEVTRLDSDSLPALRLISEDFTTELQFNSTIFHNLIMYRMEDFQPQVRMSDLVHQMQMTDTIMTALGGSRGENLEERADSIATAVVNRGFFGFLAGLPFDIYQFWVFVVCLKVTLDVISFCLCPSNVQRPTNRFNLIDLSGIGRWTDNWRQRREHDRELEDPEDSQRGNMRRGRRNNLRNRETREEIELHATARWPRNVAAQENTEISPCAEIGRANPEESPSNPVVISVTNVSDTINQPMGHERSREANVRETALRGQNSNTQSIFIGSSGGESEVKEIQEPADPLYATIDETSQRPKQKDNVDLGEMQTRQTALSRQGERKTKTVSFLGREDFPLQALEGDDSGDVETGGTAYYYDLGTNMVTSPRTPGKGPGGKAKQGTQVRLVTHTEEGSRKVQYCLMNSVSKKTRTTDNGVGSSEMKREANSPHPDPPSAKEAASNTQISLRRKNAEESAQPDAKRAAEMQTHREEVGAAHPHLGPSSSLLLGTTEQQAKTPMSQYLQPLDQQPGTSRMYQEMMPLHIETAEPMIKTNLLQIRGEHSQNLAESATKVRSRARHMQVTGPPYQTLPTTHTDRDATKYWEKWQNRARQAFEPSETVSVINGTEVISMIDTGASLSLIPARLFQSWTNVALEPSRHPVVTGLVGAAQVIGSCRVAIRLGYRSVVMRIHVVQDRDCPTGAILGVDLLRQVGKITLRYDYGMIAIDGTELPMGATNFYQGPTRPRCLMVRGGEVDKDAAYLLPPIDKEAALRYPIPMNPSWSRLLGPSETPVILHNLGTIALVDTGASLTIIPKRIFDRIKGAGWAEPVTKTITAMTGDRVQVVCSCLISINLAASRMEHVVHVVPNDACPYDLIIGVDFLQRLQRICFRYQEGIVKVNEKEMPIGKIRSKNPTVAVILAENLTLKPQSETKVVVRLRSDEGENLQGVVLLEPDMNFLEKNLLGSYVSVVTPSNEYLPMVLTNANDHDIRLYKNMTVGKAEGIISENLHNIWNWDQPATDQVVGRLVADTTGKVYSSSAIETDPKTSREGKIPNHLLDIRIGDAELTEAEKKQLWDLLTEFQDVFATGPNDLGDVKGFEHEIVTGETRPIRSQPYRVPHFQKPLMKEELERLLEARVITPSKSPWASPVLMLEKPDGSQRFITDFRKLNAVSKADAYNLPRIEDIFDEIGNNCGSAYFTQLDALSGYHQIRIREEDKDKTAFVCPYGLFRYERLAFGLHSAPSTYQRMMNTITEGLTGVVVYIDDICVYSSCLPDHLERLRALFRRLREVNLKLKPKKCTIGRASMDFLGHVVSKDGLRPNPKKVVAVQNFPRPTTVTELKGFLGLVGYYRRFVKGFSSIAAPLHQLMRKDAKWEWETAQETAYKTLTTALCKAPVLQFPNFTKPFVLYTDASGVGIGAILSQVSDEDQLMHPLAYYSRALNKAELKWSTFHTELLAVVEGIHHFRPYLYMTTFQVICDHSPIRYLHQATVNGRLLRWALMLQEYEFTVIHRAGAQNQNADSLSRAPLTTQEEPDCQCIDILKGKVAADDERIPPINAVRHDSEPPNGNEPSHLAQKQRMDKDLDVIIQYLIHKETPNTLCEHDQTKIKNEAKQYRMGEDDCLYFKEINAAPGARRQRPRLVVPTGLRAEICTVMHDSVAGGGHLGQEKTLGKIQERYYWKGMSAEIKHWVASCQVCSSRKAPPRDHREQMVPLPVGGPLSRVGIDILGPLPKSDPPEGYKYCLVITDYLTKWPEVFCMADMKAATVAKLFVEEFVTRHGAPIELLSDQGTQFISELLKEISNILDVRKVFSTPYRPQTNGLTERFNKTLIDCIACYVNKARTDWPKYINYVLFAYRVSAQASTGESPFYLMYLRDPRLPIEVALTDPVSINYLDEDDYADVVRSGLQTAWKVAREKIGVAQGRQKHHYDQRANAQEYEVGARVWVYNPAVPKGKSPKLACKWHGPFRITAVESPNVRVVPCSKPTMTPKAVHKDRLKRYVEAHVPTMWLEGITEVMQDPQVQLPIDTEGSQEKPREDHDGRMDEDQIESPAQNAEQVAPGPGGRPSGDVWIEGLEKESEEEEAPRTEGRKVNTEKTTHQAPLDPIEEEVEPDESTKRYLLRSRVLQKARQ